MRFLGNFAGTPGERVVAAYWNIRWGLSVHRKALTNVFNDAVGLDRQIAALVTASYQQDGVWTTFSGMNVSPAFMHAQNLEIANSERAAYGGLLVVVLRNLCKRFQDEAQSGPQWANLPKRFAGHTIFQVLRATSNNFRHFDDWRTTNPVKPEQRENIGVIAAVLNWPVPQDDANLRASFGQNVAWIVVNQISHSYESLEKHVIDAAEELVSAYGVPMSPTLDVARHL